MILDLETLRACYSWGDSYYGVRTHILGQGLPRMAGEIGIAHAARCGQARTYPLCRDLAEYDVICGHCLRIAYKEAADGR